MSKILFSNSIGGVDTSFDSDIQTATPGQTIFNASFNINQVFVDSILVTTGYTGQGTKTITFLVGLSDGQEVYLTS